MSARAKAGRAAQPRWGPRQSIGIDNWNMYLRAGAVVSPWSVYSESQAGLQVLRPVCRPLAYFSRPPQQLFAGDLAENGTFRSRVRLVGSAQGRRVYELDVHQITPVVEQPWSPRVIRNVLVERTPGDYCEIWKEQSGGVVLSNVLLSMIKGSTLVWARDSVIGNCGCSDQQAWVLDHGVPYYLDFFGPLEKAVDALLPPGDDVHTGDPLSVATLSYSGAVSTRGDNAHQASGGHIEIRLAIHGHTLSVTSAHYSPPAPAHRPAARP